MKRLAAIFFTLALFLPSIASAVTLRERLSGRILLQVEERGEAWYVNPINLQRYYLGRPDDAWTLMRTLALGITNADLNKIPDVTENRTGDLALRRRLAGRILLQVEEHGEAWYVDPVTLKRDYLGRPTDAFRVMRSYGLGITNRDLAEIPMATSPSAPVPPPPSDNGQDGGETLTEVPPYLQSGIFGPARRDENGELIAPAQGGGEGEVQFTSQVPFGDWDDPRQQDGCEEASTIMAVMWARGIDFTSTQARDAILDMSDWEQDVYGEFADTSAQDTASRLFERYFYYKNVEVQSNITTDDIKNELAKGHLIVAPVNGQKLNNPNFTGAGPLRHMIVISGFDEQTNTFITQDPGTQSGANDRYSASTLENALGDYPSGDHESITSRPKNMIVVSR